ncbi:hypothetical protein Acr_17g0012050 [Actinidia rufa]|uniref:Uncharacterized protein n=1 Tax=Actinidia rufa TaxID=165716 RepID=A0A7J0G4C2_9ERIC|nr:hypothetical protein Acr_17g0012050 [Actinidia rufa]
MGHGSYLHGRPDPISNHFNYVLHGTQLESRVWDLDTGVGNERVITHCCRPGAANASGSSAATGDRIVGEWVEPFTVLWDHITAKAWNKYTSIPTDERLRLFCVCFFRVIWGVTLASMGPDMASRMLRMRRKARTGLGLRKEEKRPSYSLGFAELVELLGVAYNSKPVLGNLILSSILFSICHTLASPKPPKSSENTDIKQPQTFIRGDGSVLVPDFGRYMLPRKKYKGLNPFTHNPNTGTSGGTGGVGGSSSGSGGGEPHNSVSGGDDTFIPNPGVEVPNP